MRTFVAGIALSLGLVAAIAFAQNPPNNTPGQQPGAAAQKQMHGRITARALDECSPES